jgi:hypothetical protein
MTNVDRRRAAKQVALAENLMLAPIVMAMRFPVMAAEAAESALGGRSESAGAVAEKVKAMADGMAAAQLAWMKGAMLFPWSLAKAASPSGALMDMAGDIALAALQPAAKQVRLNHRRLSRRRSK